MKATLLVLEGVWAKPTEAPMILPYVTAYANSHGDVDVQYRTIRNKADLEFYVKQIHKNKKAFVYIACHGDVGQLQPTDPKNAIDLDAVCEILGKARDGAIGFLHFGSCWFVQSSTRRETLERLRASARARWVSGYTRSIDWLPSTMFDLSLISEVYVPWRAQPTKIVNAKKRADAFLKRYGQLGRWLGFSAMMAMKDRSALLPRKVNGEKKPKKKTAT